MGKPTFAGRFPPPQRSSLAKEQKSSRLRGEQVFPTSQAQYRSGCMLIHATLPSGGIDRRLGKPDPPASRAAAQAGQIRQGEVPFRK